MRAILVDDEPLALQYLENQLIKLNDIEVIGAFTFLELDKEAELIKESDIIFLDIEMPEVNGLELAEQLLQVKPDLSIIFVTAFNEYAVEAFDLNALDYILKPVDTDRLTKTLNRISSNKRVDIKQARANNDLLRINLCHDLAFQIDNREFKHIKWRTTRAKDLFIYLLYHHGQTNRKAKLVDLYWGDLPEERAYSQLYTAIYHVRKTIEAFSDHFSLRSLHESYVLEAKNVLIDVKEWESKLKKLDKISHSTIDEWEKSMKIYSDHFLRDYDMHWIQTERFRLEQIWIKAAFQIADFYRDTNQIEKAEQSYLKITQFKPEEENAHLEIMKIYEQLGLGLLIDHQYNTLLRISNELECDMGSHINEWYTNWKK